MANLDYDGFTESVRTILKLRNQQDEAIVREIVEAAVRDLIEEFDSEIGSRTDYTLTVENVMIGDEAEVSRIILPDDCHYVRQVYLNNCLVTPINIADAKMHESDPHSGSIHAFAGRSEDGCMYIEFAELLREDICDVRVLYRVHSSDISYIPEAFKNLVLYAAMYHYRNWYTLDDPAMQSKAEAVYNKYLARMRAEQANQNTNNKRPYEVEWKKMFRFILEGSREDFYSRYTGSN